MGLELVRGIGKRKEEGIRRQKGGKGGFRKNTPKSLKGKRRFTPPRLMVERMDLFFTKRTPSFLLEDFLLHQPDRHTF